MAEKDDAPPPPPPPEGGGNSGAGAATAVQAKEVKSKPTGKPNPAKLPPYNVVLLDDDDHSYAYVIEMLGAVFGHEERKAYRMAKEVDKSGRVIVLTTHKEKAELKRDQVMAYGADVRIASCKGSMAAVVEPAEG